MSEILEQVGALVQRLILQLGYPGVGAVMLIENVFPPIPSEVVMPFAGFLVGRGELSFVGILVAGTLGSVLGALLLYYVGMWVGDGVVRGFLRRYGKWIMTSEADYNRALRFFDRYGSAVVFFGRLIPLVRSIISIPAGANHMPLPRFLLFTTLGAALWSGALAYAGVVMGENWHQIISLIDRYQTLTIIVAVVAAVLLAGGWLFRRLKRSKAADPMRTPS
jgi:membrane protein DedA with SNARE-associated domain